MDDLKALNPSALRMASLPSLCSDRCDADRCIPPVAPTLAAADPEVKEWWERDRLIMAAPRRSAWSTARAWREEERLRPPPLIQTAAGGRKDGSGEPRAKGLLQWETGPVVRAVSQSDVEEPHDRRVHCRVKERGR
jgi:hypothetical protein